MKIIQILPELDAGGVERGTLEIACHLAASGHDSVVISNGGRLVERLEREGSRHIAMPVHRKSLASLKQVFPLRRLIEAEKPDILHYRSRVPGWLAWLAWRGMDPASRPRLVSTVHGFYSVNAYSAVMTRGQRVVAVSDSVREYIFKNYPRVSRDKVRVIHRGVDPVEFPLDHVPDESWLRDWKEAHPGLEGKRILLMPGRLTRWKGQEHFLQMIARLVSDGRAVHGLIAGDPHPRKRAYLGELEALTDALGIRASVTFLGHRSDLREVMAMSDVVFSLSLDPEAFGRVSLEAMALGKPVVAYDHGGVGEQLRALFPQGLVPVGDVGRVAEKTVSILESGTRLSDGIEPFTLQRMREATLAIYREIAGA